MSFQNSRFLLLLIWPFSLSWASSVSSECFNFKEVVKKPLREPIPFLNQQQEAVSSGQFPSEVNWGAARAIINKPIGMVIKALLNPLTIKGPEHKDAPIVKEERPGYLSFQRLKMKIKPTFFLTLEWDEEWGYVLLKPEPQSSMLLSYQKVNGTSHIERFCGSVLIQSLGETKTDVFLYEELKATRRGREDIVKGHQGTLDALRK